MRIAKYMMLLHEVADVCVIQFMKMEFNLTINICMLYTNEF